MNIRRWSFFVIISASLGVAATLTPLPRTEGPLRGEDWPGRSTNDVLERLRDGYLVEVEPTLRTKCYACHVDERFDRGEPWIAEWIPPAQRAVKQDIELGLAALDLSGGFPFVRDGEVDLRAQPGLLARLADAVADDSMPPRQFRWVHPGAPLTANEREAVLRWTAAAQARLTGSYSASGPEGRLARALDRSCGACHGADRTLAGPEISNLSELLEAGWVRPDDVAGSLMVQRLRSGTMPPPGAGEAPDTLLSDLEQWISNGARLDTDVRPPASREALLAAVRADLEAMPRGRRAFVRYFSAEHLTPARQDPGELALTEYALRWVASALSHTPETAQVERLAASELLVFRVDFSRTGWTEHELTYLDAAYPFNWRPHGAAGVHSDAIRSLTSGAVDVFAVDWFVRTATLPPMYPELARIPERLSALAAREGVDLCDVQESDKVQRAGFTNSGVSSFNRLVERHATERGAFWISYDFGRRGGNADLFTHPFGPPCTGDPLAFIPDGSELIWSLPNGLHAYGLFDGDGYRLDIDAPRDIVQDNRRAISNASSCMGCHVVGILPVRDEVARAASGLSAERVRARFANEMSLTSSVTADTEAFLSALLAAGISPLLERPPIGVLSGRFDRDILLADLLALMGLPSTSSLTNDSMWNGQLQPLLDGHALSRAELIQHFPDIVRDLNAGEPLPPTLALPFDDQDRRRLQLQRRQRSTALPSYELLLFREGEVQFLLGATEVTRAQWEAVMGEPGSRDCERQMVVTFATSGLKLLDDHLPQICVTFLDAATFANQLSRMDGLTPAYTIRDRDIVLSQTADGYRLPSESEWRIAAGPENNYAGGVLPGQVCGAANVLSQSDALILGFDQGEAFPCEDGFGGLADVARFEPTDEEIYDLTGNAAEWAWPEDASTTDPGLPQMVLGGSWLDGIASASASTVQRRPGSEATPSIGFRLARSIPVDGH